MDRAIAEVTYSDGSKRRVEFAGALAVEQVNPPAPFVDIDLGELRTVGRIYFEDAAPEGSRDTFVLASAEPFPPRLLTGAELAGAVDNSGGATHPHPVYLKNPVLARYVRVQAKTPGLQHVACRVVSTAPEAATPAPPPPGPSEPPPDVKQAMAWAPGGLYIGSCWFEATGQPFQTVAEFQAWQPLYSLGRVEVVAAMKAGTPPKV